MSTATGIKLIARLTPVTSSRSYYIVIASAAKQSSRKDSPRRRLDCFAALVMTTLWRVVHHNTAEHSVSLHATRRPERQKPGAASRARNERQRARGRVGNGV